MRCGITLHCWIAIEVGQGKPKQALMKEKYRLRYQSAELEVEDSGTLNELYLNNCQLPVNERYAFPSMSARFKVYGLLSFYTDLRVNFFSLFQK